MSDGSSDAVRFRRPSEQESDDAEIAAVDFQCAVPVTGAEDDIVAEFFRSPDPLDEGGEERGGILLAHGRPVTRLRPHRGVPSGPYS